MWQSCMHRIVEQYSTKLMLIQRQKSSSVQCWNRLPDWSICLSLSLCVCMYNWPPIHLVVNWVKSPKEATWTFKSKHFNVFIYDVRTMGKWRLCLCSCLLAAAENTLAHRIFQISISVHNFAHTYTEFHQNVSACSFSHTHTFYN